MNKKVYKITSILLQYPTEQWLNDIPLMEEEMNKMDDSYFHKTLQPFFHYVYSNSLDRLCENYVNTFDYHGITTLHLTYNVFKDSRKRGEALIQLRKIFNHSKYYPLTDELPDYLPLILEFLSLAPKKEENKLIALHHRSINKLYEELQKNNSKYKYILQSVNYIATHHLENKDVS